MTKIAGMERENVDASLRALLAADITHGNLTAAGAVTKSITTVFAAGSDRAVTLPSANPLTSPAGTTYVVIKTDAAGAGKVVLTPATGDAIGAAAVDATWTSPASAVNSIVLIATPDPEPIISPVVHRWAIVSQSGTWV